MPENCSSLLKLFQSKVLNVTNSGSKVGHTSLKTRFELDTSTIFSGSNLSFLVLAESSPFIIVEYKFVLITLSFFSFKIRFEPISDKAVFFS